MQKNEQESAEVNEKEITGPVKKYIPPREKKNYQDPKFYLSSIPTGFSEEKAYFFIEFIHFQIFIHFH